MLVFPMRVPRLAIFALFIVGAAQTYSQLVSGPPNTGQAPVRPFDAKQQERMKWFGEARLGLFIHWGLYSIPAGQWPGRESTRRGEWIMLEENVPSAEYEKLARQFSPVKFDAKAWVEVAKAAGFRYLVVTTKHHDGFCLFPSRFTDYDIADATPFGRDPIRELADACREAGIVFCVYYSVADWHHPEFPAKYSQPAREPSTDRRSTTQGFHGAPKPDADIGKYADYLRAQVRELLTNYGPIGIVWFDGGGALRVPNRAELIKGDELVAMINAVQPATLINNRAGVMADYGTPEQRIPGGRTVEPFEVCMTLNRKWGYNRFDREWKSPALVVRNIADIVSKGGNYLVNVGPTGDGELPKEDVEILREVGRWTHAHAEAIYGAGPTPFGEELGHENPAEKDAHGAPAWVSREEWRCTTKPGKLFFHLLRWPDGKFVLPAFPNRVRRAYLLADPARTPLIIRDGVILLPAAAPGGLVPVICVEIDGEVKPGGARNALEAGKDAES